MKPYHCACWSALTGVSDTRPRGIGEVRDLQRRAWRDRGLMVLSGEDERLTDEDRSDLHRIGQRLFRER